MSPILELRQYTLRAGKREALIELFDRALLDPQESLGMRVVGQFRDLDREDHFVWLRGFSTMDARKEALESFYGGPIWKAHRDEANATMIDSDDVLLLRPVEAGSGFSLPERRPASEETAGARASSSIVAHLYFLRAPVDDAFVSHFKATLQPILIETGAPPIACLQTEPAENTFPALPVRTGENVFVWFAAFDTPEAHRDHLARLASSKAWSAMLVELSPRFKSPAQTLRLEPTVRSLLGHRSGGRHDFDFYVGRWQVKNRRLKVRGVGSQDWDEFPAISDAQSYLEGVANVDQIDFATKGWSGMTVRTFDTQRSEWSLYWIDGRTGRLFPPVRGGFVGDHGVFYGDDDDDGRPVRVRFDWYKRTADSVRWEQAFSYDGTTWETNWTMDSIRDRPVR